MYLPIRLFLGGFLMIGLVAPQLVSAQDDNEDDEETVIESENERRIIRRSPRGMLNRFRYRGEPHIEHRGEIIFRDEDGNERRFTMDGDDMQGYGDGDVAVTDTTIDGQRVIIIRTPDGGEEIIELDGMGGNAFAFRMPDFNVPHFDRGFDIDIPDMHFRMFGEKGLNGFAFGPDFLHLEGMMGASSETRREMMELERHSMELAARIRHDEEGERAELERELDDVLESLFDLRGQARAERADHIAEQAEELRQEAQELRESLNERNRDRSNIIEERKRELLGERGHGW